MRMNDWVQKLDGFLQFNERNVLTHIGKISHELATARAEEEYEHYQAHVRHVEATEATSDFDKMIADLSLTAQRPRNTT